MPVLPPTPERMEEVLASMRATVHARREAAPGPVNEDATLALLEPPPLRWGSAEYRVRNISYREGLKLHRAMRQFRQLATDNDGDLDQHERLFEEVLEMFHSFLEPRPPANPFHDVTPVEVGELASFFTICQRIQNHPLRTTASRLRSIS